MNVSDLNSLCLRAQNRKNLHWISADLSDLSSPWSSTDSSFFSGFKEDFIRAVEKLYARLVDTPEIKGLFDLFLLTRYLLTSSGNNPKWIESWLDRNIDINQHFPGIARKQLSGGNFRAVPVVTVINEACIQYFITGMIKGPDDDSLWPDWVDHLLDDRAEKSVRSAAMAARQISALQTGYRLYCYPLTTANKKRQFSGSSLGLALSIGFLSVLNNTSISTRLLATGSINNEGDVLRVGNLDHKLSCASRKGFSVFLRPDQDFPVSPPKNLEVIPVADLAEAWLFASLYAPGRGQELLTLLSMLRNPRTFVNNIDHINHRWVLRICREAKGQKIVESVVGSPVLASDFVDQLSRVLKSRNLDTSSALCGLISEDLFQRMQTTSPLTAFKFCTRNVALYNHRGNVIEADHWGANGEALFPKALMADIDACADFVNNRFVSRHNRYNFEPKLPKEVADLLASLKKRYAVQCDSGCISDPVLGELCGTIAQNLAFCGPEYIRAFNEFIRQAVDAFGGNRVAEYKHQILREYCYQVYAFLDAGRIDEAESKLLDYLEVEDLQHILADLDGKALDPFQHAALARFLADSPFEDRQKIYLKWALKQKGKFPVSYHPGQLWSHNIGRMAHRNKDHDAAANMYRQSFKLCMQDDRHPTVLVMALLPLAGLKQINLLENLNIKENENLIKTAARKLDSGHFKPLFKNDFKTILDQVWAQPQKLYPFTYR